MDTQTQVERLIELAIIQRAELKRLVEELPQLREHLNAEVERTFEETEPQLRAELEEFVAKQAEDKTSALGVALEARISQLAKTLQDSAQAKFSAIMAAREQNAELLKIAEGKIAEAAAALPSNVKEIVTAELARFPRAGEIDKLRKEFAEPRGLNPRGKWTSGETYNKLDLVSYNGDSFVSSIDGNTEKPSRNGGAWTLSAARGGYGGGGGITSLIDLYNKPANGEVLIGNGTDFAKNTLTAGTGISITNGAGTIIIDATGAQETLTATVTNAESVPITRGQVVYIFGATGNRPSVKLASNASEATSSKTFGVVSDASIAANGIGTVTCVGVVDQLSLGSYSEGATVYLGSTAGTFTATKPAAPNHLVYVGIVQRANNGNGQLYVKIQNGYELDEIHDVQINAPKQAGQTLIYDATNSLWKNARLTAGVGVSITNADSSITISADGGVNYQGTWNASTNSPALTSSVGTKGFYYVVSVAGSTNLNGITDWQVGDWAIFNGSAWQKVDTTDQVSSVFGRTGAVVGVSTDYSSVGITNTAIGASNPSTGAFTTLSATSNLTVSGATNLATGQYVKLGTSFFAVQDNSSGTNYLFSGGSGGIIFRNGNDSGTIATLSNGGNLFAAGNLTVSGTTSVGATSGLVDALLYLDRSTTARTSQLQFRTAGVADWQVYTAGATSPLSFYSSGSDRFSITQAGNATLAGNLTVSGAGTSSVAGQLVVSGAGASGGIGLGGTAFANGDFQLRYNGVGFDINTLAGSRFVSFSINSAEAGRFAATTGNLLLGTTSDTWSAKLAVVGNVSITGGNKLYLWDSTNAYTPSIWANGNAIAFAPNSGTEAMRVNSSGNLLLGTTTDSGNGKLQLATHTTSAGGIGFGTDTSLYRTDTGSLAINGGTLPILRFYNGASQYGYVYAGSGDGELSVINGPLRLKSSGTTALTLDSSQNASFAGSIRAGTSFTPAAWGVKAVEVNDAGGGLFAVYYGGTAKGYMIARTGSIAFVTQLNGNIELEAGTGKIKLASKINASALPTSSSGLSSGDIWNNSGVLNIVP